MVHGPVGGSDGAWSSGGVRWCMVQQGGQMVHGLAGGVRWCMVRQGGGSDGAWSGRGGQMVHGPVGGGGSDGAWSRE